MKKSVIFLKDWKILVESLPTEKQLIFWNLFVNYPELECTDSMVLPVWNFIKIQIDNMDSNYQKNIVDRNKNNGSKGGRPKQTQKTETNPKNPLGNLETQKTLNENKNKNININNIPSFEEFKIYAQEKMADVDLEKLGLKYASWNENNWSTGKGDKIKNWKTTLLNTLPYLKKEKKTESKGKYDGWTMYHAGNG